jgi:hypothetical protein
MERPPAPPEAVLIRLAREAAGIRVAEASKRAGVSVARWSQIESGSENRHGTVSPVTGRAGITPERMAAEGRRPDAAEILREILRQEPTMLPPSRQDGPPLPEFTPGMAADMTTYVDEVRLRVQLARRHHPDGPLTGPQVFPVDRRSAFFWDTVTTVGFRQEEGVIQGTAALMTQAAQEDAAGQAGNTATGLAHPAGHAGRIHSAFARA